MLRLSNCPRSKPLRIGSRDSSVRLCRRFLSGEASSPREAMEYDVVVVGAGPAGLSAAIRLKQRANKEGKDINVCVVEKGAEVGSHILSGNVFDPISLNELFPDWKEREAPLVTPVKKDKFLFLTEKHAIPLPVPPPLHNEGNYIISLGGLVRWLGKQAEELGIEIYPGFSASEVLYNEKGSVCGIATSDVGIGKDGQPKPNFQRGMELRAKQTLFAEGVRGSLSELVMKKFDLRKNSDPQSYGIGIKEVWEVESDKFEEGLVVHTLGWPVSVSSWCGTFMYHMAPNKVLIGIVLGLDYKNPYLNPYMEFQRFKHHPSVSKYLKGGKCVAYGARAINEGGLQSLPSLTFPGGALIGCSAGFLNVPRIKGSHTAMKTGMLAADAIYDQYTNDEDISDKQIVQYEEDFRQSWVYKELHAVRNVHPSHKYGVPFFFAYSFLDSFLFKGRTPWTFHNSKTDAEKTLPASQCKPIEYPKPDGELSFDILTNLTRSGTNHNHDQPSHLRIRPEKADVPKNTSYQVYGAPETRFCPAKVYEYVTDEQGQNPSLVINAQNCVHCKTCDIKTPENYIQWTVPEGGGGPSYENM